MSVSFIVSAHPQSDPVSTLANKIRSNIIQQAKQGDTELVQGTIEDMIELTDLLAGRGIDVGVFLTCWLKLLTRTGEIVLPQDQMDRLVLEIIAPDLVTA